MDIALTPGDPLVLNLGLWTERLEETDTFD
jgi:hypothetical protein